MTHSLKAFLKSSTLLVTTTLIVACGGGSSSGSTTPPTVTNAGPTYTAGKYDPSSTFDDICNATTEKFWLRSWTDETYLWYNEVPDLNPVNSDTPVEFFDKLKTSATTASGTPRDQFHFSIPTDEYNELVNSGASAGYGADFVLIQSSPPREIRVALTQPNSPASASTNGAVNFLRGAEILEIDGVDAVNGSDTATLNAGLFPDAAGESHTFTVRDVGSTTTRTVTLTSQIVAEQPVNTTEVIDTADGKVGYILFTTFGTNSAEQQIVNAMTEMKTAGIDDLVLDLRYNGGGFLDIAAQIGYMIAGDARTNGRTFDKLTFNDKHPVTNPVTGRTITPTPFHKTGQDFSVSENTTLPTLDLGRVFILTTDGTCSASEAVINGLRGVDVEVIIIGTKTCGKPYGFYATDNCGETYFTVQFSGQNDKGFGDYADGFTPMDDPSVIGEKITGCIVPDDFFNALGSESEALLETALAYQASGECPVSTVASAALSKPSYDFLRDSSLSLLNEERVRNRNLLRNSRIETQR